MDLTAPPNDRTTPASMGGRFLAGRSRQEVALLLTYLYVFLVTLGVLQRPFGNPFGLGISSIVSIAIVALLFREALRAIRVHRILQMWIALTAYVFVITLATHPDLSLSNPEYLRIPGLLAGCLLCAATANLSWNAARLRGVGLSMLAGLAIAGTLAVVDDAGIVDLPLMNISLINDPPIREPVAQFGHRSIMSLYLGLMLPFLFVMEDRDPSRWLRVAVIVVGVCFLYFLIYSRNRSGFGAIAIAMATYYAFNLRHGERWLHPRVPGFALTLVLAFVVVFAFRAPQGGTFFVLWATSPFFSDILSFLPNLPVSQGNTLADLADTKMNPVQARNLYESDMLRVEIVKETVASLRENIFGRGFMANTHVHFVIDIIHAAGVVGILWLVAFAYCLANMIRSIVRSGMDRTNLWLLLTPLIAWFWVGLMFNAINLGLGWVFLGMLLALHATVRVR